MFSLRLGAAVVRTSVSWTMAIVSLHSWPNGSWRQSFDRRHERFRLRRQPPSYLPLLGVAGEVSLKGGRQRGQLSGQVETRRRLELREERVRGVVSLVVVRHPRLVADGRNMLVVLGEDGPRDLPVGRVGCLQVWQCTLTRFQG